MKRLLTTQDGDVLLLWALIAFGAIAPAFVYPVFAMKLMCFMLFAAAFNLMLGYVGMLAFGHAAFFGGAGYMTGFMLKDMGVNPEIAILAGVAFATLLGLVMGLLSRGRQGIYLAMITLALAQLFYFLCVQSPITRGENGMTSIPRGQLFGVIDLRNDMTLYYVVLVLVGASLLAIRRIVTSPLGQVLRSIRDNEPRAISLGYDAERFKLMAFVLSAAFSGLAGALKAVVLQLVTLADVSWTISGEVILMTLIGGIGVTLGPVIGAGIIISMHNFMSGVGPWVITIQGAIFFVTILLFRRGVVGELARLRQRPAARRTVAASADTIQSDGGKP